MFSITRLIRPALLSLVAWTLTLAPVCAQDTRDTPDTRDGQDGKTGPTVLDVRCQPQFVPLFKALAKEYTAGLDQVEARVTSRGMDAGGDTLGPARAGMVVVAAKPGPDNEYPADVTPDMVAASPDAPGATGATGVTGVTGVTGQDTGSDDPGSAREDASTPESGLAGTLLPREPEAAVPEPARTVRTTLFQCLVPIIHPDNPAYNVSLEELAAVFAGRYSRWKSLPGGPEKLRIQVLALAEDAPGAAWWNQTVMRNARVFMGALFLSRGRAVLESVAGNHRAVGYVHLPLLLDTPGAAAPLSVDGVKVDVGTVLSGEYPLCRAMQVVVPDFDPTSRAASFLSFVSQRRDILMGMAGLKAMDPPAYHPKPPDEDGDEQ